MIKKNIIDCQYVPLSEDNLSWFIPLFKLAFKRDISLSELKKKYDHTFMDKPYLGLFAVHNNVPIGFIGICYYWANNNGKRELACNFTDSMIHPDFQGLSVYIKLLSKVEQLVKDNGICFSLGFPNDNSFYPVVHKGMWNFKNRMMGYLIPVNTLPIRRLLNVMGLNNLYLNWAQRKLKTHITPYNDEAFIESDILPHIVHDELFFQYKSSPAHFLLKLNDVHVWIKLSHQMAIGFIQEMDDAKLLLVIDSLKKLAKKLYIQQLMFQFTKDSHQDLLFKKHFKSFESWPILYTNQQSKFNLDQLQVQYCDIDSF